MRHEHGHWLADAPPPAPQPPLDGSHRADFLIIGGGYTGLWAAWHLLDVEPEATVVILEADEVGLGPSGRNAGFVNSMWFLASILRSRFTDFDAIRMARAAAESVAEVGRFCAEQDVDAWYRRAGYLQVSAAPAQDGIWEEIVKDCRELGAPEAAMALSPAGVSARFRSPRARGGVFFSDAATVHPARLAHDLKERLLGRGALICDHSRVSSLSTAPGGVIARTANGTVSAKRAVLATGSALAGSGSPMRDRLTATSSHMVVTEPVPDLLEEIGWTGGECITDARSMIHYFRTTPDGRIAFGWGGGRIICGGRLRGFAEVDRRVAGEVARHLVEFFPGLEGRRIEHAWGGPIDASPWHLPTVTQLPGESAFAAFGYTGNGVGPSQMVGRTLSSLLLDRADDHSRLPMVDPDPRRLPPEPLRWLGGTAIREGLVRSERAEELGRRAWPLSRAVAGVPKLIGFHIGR